MNGIKSAFTALAAAAFVAGSLPAGAHHSFSGWDMETEVEFTGVVKTLKLRNPHMAMTLERTTENGKTEIVNFTEGAPANMLARMGVKEAMIEPGSKITAVGAPGKENPDTYFLKRIILPDGREFDVLNQD